MQTKFEHPNKSRKPHGMTVIIKDHFIQILPFNLLPSYLKIFQHQLELLGHR